MSQSRLATPNTGEPAVTCNLLRGDAAVPLCLRTPSGAEYFWQSDLTLKVDAATTDVIAARFQMVKPRA
jgi:hypothetical protein